MAEAKAADPAAAKVKHEAKPGVLWASLLKPGSPPGDDWEIVSPRSPAQQAATLTVLSRTTSGSSDGRAAGATLSPPQTFSTTGTTRTGSAACPIPAPSPGSAAPCGVSQPARDGKPESSTAARKMSWADRVTGAPRAVAPGGPPTTVSSSLQATSGGAQPAGPAVGAPPRHDARPSPPQRAEDGGATVNGGGVTVAREPHTPADGHARVRNVSEFFHAAPRASRKPNGQVSLALAPPRAATDSAPSTTQGSKPAAAAKAAPDRSLLFSLGGPSLVAAVASTEAEEEDGWTRVGGWGHAQELAGAIARAGAAEDEGPMLQTDSDEFGEYRARWLVEQRALARRVQLADNHEWSPATLRLVGGLDISFIKGNERDACVCLVVIELPSMNIVYQECCMVTLHLPYIPSFLAFREAPALLEMVDRLRQTRPELLPQVLIMDGNGVLHPRRCGLASHLGVLLDIPTIGCAKKLYYTDGIDKPANGVLRAAGDFVELIGQSGRCWGAALRMCASAPNPVFVSVGHRVSLETALAVCMACGAFRVPEPVRLADKLSRAFLRERGYATGME